SHVRPLGVIREGDEGGDSRQGEETIIDVDESSWIVAAGVRVSADVRRCENGFEEIVVERANALDASSQKDRLWRDQFSILIIELDVDPWVAPHAGSREIVAVVIGRA